MPKITIQYTEYDIKQLILNDLADKMPGKTFTERDVAIETKSKQNYRSEWENAAFRASVNTF